jgi:hypothetical protein
VDEVDIGGFARQIRRFGNGIFGKRATGYDTIDRIARRKALHALADRRDHSADLPAEIDGQGHSHALTCTAANLPVDRVHPCRSDLD